MQTRGNFMAIKDRLNPEQNKQAICEELWLKYYNQVLYENGLISERERNMMLNKIDARTIKSLSR